jgi:Zn-dependent protease with chaperone function
MSPRLRSLRLRLRLVSPFYRGSNVAEFLLPILLLPVVVTIGAFGRTLRLLSYRQGQRCEYNADELAARAAGTPGAVSLTETLLIGDICSTTLVHR